MKFDHMIFHISGYVHEFFYYYIIFSTIIVYKKNYREILNGVNRFKLNNFKSGKGWRLKKSETVDDTRSYNTFVIVFM